MSMLPSSVRIACSPRRLSARRRLQAVAVSALALLLAGTPAVAAGPAAAAPAAKDAKAAATAKPKKAKKGKRPKGTVATLSQMLTEKSSLVQDCAVQNALDRGSGRVDIATRVTINNRGQVISINTNVTLDKGDGGPRVKDCIETLVRAIAFPPSDAPMITIERNWTISG